MVFLVVWIGTMRFANTTDFFHDRSLPARTISKKSPIGTPAAINDVINRRRAQDISWLNVPMIHKLLFFTMTTFGADYSCLPSDPRV
jgi:hypothetical protein